MRYIFQTPEWFGADFHVAILETNHRQDNDKEFLENLNKVKVGEIDKNVEKYLDTLQRPLTLPLGASSLKLRPTRIEVEEINQSEFDKLPGKKWTYQSQEKGAYFKFLGYTDKLARRRHRERASKGQERIKMPQDRMVLHRYLSKPELEANGNLSLFYSFI